MVKVMNEYRIAAWSCVRSFGAEKRSEMEIMPKLRGTPEKKNLINGLLT